MSIDTIFFVFFMLVYLVVGFSAFIFKETEQKDYWLAGRSSSSFLVALSCGASAQSGFLWLAVTGAVYLKGISSLWAT